MILGEEQAEIDRAVKKCWRIDQTEETSLDGSSDEGDIKTAISIEFLILE